MKIFLVGFMGSGKTTFGRKLAKSLKAEFIDLDELIGKEAGMSITQYFREFGEPAFRELERTVLKNTRYPDPSVTATGGGTPCFSDNMDWMNAHGTTVYLSLTPQALAERLKHGQEERPLIRDIHKDDLTAFIADKLSQREECYKKARYVTDGMNITVEKFLTDISSKM